MGATCAIIRMYFTHDINAQLLTHPNPLAYRNVIIGEAGYHQTLGARRRKDER